MIQAKQHGRDRHREALCATDEARMVAQSDSRQGEAFRKLLHGQVSGAVLGNYLDRPINGGFGNAVADLLKSTAADYVRDVLKRMDPRDPLEELLIVQCLWTHARVAHLTNLASRQTTAEGSKRLNDSACKASNTLRRHMLALAEYRRPPRAGDTFTAIKQANIAQQQVVQNVESGGSKIENATNEKGMSDDATTSAAIPADTGGTKIATSGRSADTAVAV